MTFAPPLIILEGADGVGKSTLGRALAMELSGFYFHATATRTLVAAMQDYQVNIMENIEENVKLGQCMILDRFWPSEVVYGKVLRPTNPHGFDYRALEARCEKLNAVYVYCFSNTAIARHEAGHKDPKHPYDDTIFRKVYAEYEEHYQSRSHLPNVLKYVMEHHGKNIRDFSALIKLAYARSCTKSTMP